MQVQTIAGQGGVVSASSANDAPKAARAKPTGRADSVEWSRGVARAKFSEIIIERTLIRIEQRSWEGGIVSAGGQSETLASSPAGGDQSPEAVSQRIFDGITGYIFAGFALTRPDMTPEDLAFFREEVTEGIHRGVEEAREILNALSVLDDELDNKINETIDLLVDKLDRWFGEMEQALAGSDEKAG